MSPSRKKVIVRRLSGDAIFGYLPPNRFVQSTSPAPAPSSTSERLTPNRTLDLLDLDGRGLPMPLAEVKIICFVRDFNRDDAENPERFTRRAFLARPRGEGLWLRITFPTGDQIEGLAPQDVTLLDALLEDAGIFLTPPDERANTHRIYVPRSAIATVELLAVINAPAHRKPSKSAPNTTQTTLFSV